ncbi:MAG: glycosyltransferase [Clostridia bacterium]|jgi:glycosyltransferase EpsE|nr:glycosyltransferase [Clostridia bacterium]
MPKVSVIMGVFNTENEEILKKSIYSILNQTYEDFEFIICDDGSKDNTLENVKKICKNDNRVIILENKENKGLAYTLNKCLKVAKGIYIARMDADDEANLERFEKQVKFLDENLEYGVVASNVNVFDENGIYKELCYNVIIQKEDFLKNSPIIHPSIMVRKEAYKLIEGYRDIPKTLRTEDYDLFMRMIAANIKIYTIQEKLLNYRIDQDTYKNRRKYKYRINEFKVRCEGFKKLGLMPKGYIFAIRPLIVGLLPKKLLKYLQRKK